MLLRKELSIQEKAQLYDEAIERANELLYVIDKKSLQYKAITHILPYLKDNDERIREALIRFHKSTIDIDGIKGEEIIAWLEKQDEQKPNPYSGTSFEYNGHTWGMCARDNGVEILIDGHLNGRVFTDDSNAKEMFIKALERVEEQNAKGYKLTDCDKNSWWEDFKSYIGYSEQILANSAKTCKDEQKHINEQASVLDKHIDEFINQNPADKVEPRFKVGDWVVYNISESVYQVEKKENYEYTLRHISGGSLCLSFSNEERIREWTIQDAKDGDVLEFGDHGGLVVGIVSYINKSTGKVDVHCLLENNKFKVGNYYALDTIKPHPASREKRDALMKAMADAGYEWNAGKKELKYKLTEFEKAIKDMMDNYRAAIDEDEATAEEVKNVQNTYYL